MTPVLLLILGCLTALCAFGFLAAAAVSFSQYAHAAHRGSLAFFVADMLTFGGASLLAGIGENWRSRPDLRRLATLGCGFSFVAGLLLYGAFHLAH